MPGTHFWDSIYGENINGSIVQPYFIITSVNKTSKSIKIEVLQHHILLRSFTAGIGSVTRKSLGGIYTQSQQPEEFDIAAYNPDSDWYSFFYGDILDRI